jgi:hypothetical protein
MTPGGLDGIQNKAFKRIKTTWNRASYKESVMYKAHLTKVYIFHSILQIVK